jgi:hypothetical protein
MWCAYTTEWVTTEDAFYLHKASSTKYRRTFGMVSPHYIVDAWYAEKTLPPSMRMLQSVLQNMSGLVSSLPEDSTFSLYGPKSSVVQKCPLADFYLQSPAKTQKFDFHIQLCDERSVQAVFSSTSIPTNGVMGAKTATDPLCLHSNEQILTRLKYRRSWIMSLHAFNKYILGVDEPFSPIDGIVPYWRVDISLTWRHRTAETCHLMKNTYLNSNGACDAAYTPAFEVELECITPDIHLSVIEARICDAGETFTPQHQHQLLVDEMLSISSFLFVEDDEAIAS